MSLAYGLRTAVSSTSDLLTYLRERGVDPGLAGLDRLSPPRVLPVRVPRYYLDLIEWTNPADPIRRQVLPEADEHATFPEELVDPIGDDVHSPVPGIVHRYPDRVLLLLTTACAVHCRFCFRREFVGQPMRTLRRDQLEAAFHYVETHPDVWEVILSGGDALVFPDASLERVLRRLRSIPHVRIVRIHSRLPAVLPHRLTPALAELLRRHAPVYVVVHVNHAREVTVDFARHVGHLVDAGVPVLSQSVLLRGVNDDLTALESLFRRLVEVRVKPYYLHQLDLAPGTNHFRVPMLEGQRLMRALRGRVSGLCLPTYVLDVPGGSGKVPITGDYVHARGPGRFSVESNRGERLDYAEPSAS